MQPTPLLITLATLLCAANADSSLESLLPLEPTTNQTAAAIQLCQYLVGGEVGSSTSLVLTMYVNVCIMCVGFYMLGRHDGAAALLNRDFHHL